jgi:hypothetical protein
MKKVLSKLCSDLFLQVRAYNKFTQNPVGQQILAAGHGGEVSLSLLIETNGNQQASSIRNHCNVWQDHGFILRTSPPDKKIKYGPNLDQIALIEDLVKELEKITKEDALLVLDFLSDQFSTELLQMGFVPRERINPSVKKTSEAVALQYIKNKANKIPVFVTYDADKKGLVVFPSAKNAALKSISLLNLFVKYEQQQQEINEPNTVG